MQAPRPKSSERNPKFQRAALGLPDDWEERLRGLTAAEQGARLRIWLRRGLGGWNKTARDRTAPPGEQTLGFLAEHRVEELLVALQLPVELPLFLLWVPGGCP